MITKKQITEQSTQKVKVWEWANAMPATRSAPQTKVKLNAVCSKGWWLVALALKDCLEQWKALNTALHWGKRAIRSEGGASMKRVARLRSFMALSLKADSEPGAGHLAADTYRSLARPACVSTIALLDLSSSPLLLEACDVWDIYKQQFWSNAKTFRLNIIILSRLLESHQRTAIRQFTTH